MFEQTMLCELVQELLDTTQHAERAYAGLAARLSDPALRRQVQLLAREKQRHVELAERLLEIISY